MDHVEVAPEAVTVDDRAQMVARLEQAIASRQEIDQAKGILIATYRMSSDDAWSLLSTVSQRCNVKVRRLARVLVQIVSQLQPDDESAEAAARRYLLPLDWPGHFPDALGARDRRLLGDARDLLASDRDVAAAARDQDADARVEGRPTATSLSDAAADRAAAREDRHRAATDRHLSAEDRAAAERSERRS